MTEWIQYEMVSRGSLDNDLKGKCNKFTKSIQFFLLGACVCTIYWILLTNFEFTSDVSVACKEASIRSIHNESHYSFTVLVTSFPVGCTTPVVLTGQYPDKLYGGVTYHVLHARCCELLYLIK